MNGKEKENTFRHNQLQDSSSTHRFPSDIEPIAPSPQWAYSNRFELHSELCETLYLTEENRLCTAHQLLVNMFQLLLSRYSESTDVVVGINTKNIDVSSSSENISERERLLPFSLSYQPTATVSDIISSHLDEFNKLNASTNSHSLQNNEDADIVAELSLKNLFLFYHLQSSSVVTPLDNLKLQQNEDRQIAFMVVAQNREFHLQAMYRADLFSNQFIQHLIENYSTLLTKALAHINKPAIEIEMVSGREHAEIASFLESGYKTQVDFFGQRVPQQFEHLSNLSPHAKAISFLNGDTISYGELNKQANRISSFLQKKGVKKGNFVGLCVSRDQELLSTLIGILKLGAVYIPMDPNYPQARLEYIAQDSGLQHLVHNDLRLADSLNNDFTKVDVREAFKSHDTEFISPVIHPDDLSHIIYTSGSTGRPKGVKISHKNVLALLDWVKHTYTESELSSVLFSTSICFDLSIFEIWAPLSNGGAIHQVDSGIELCFQAVDSLTMINTVPSVLKVLVEEEAIPESITVVNVAGEPLHKDLVNSIFNTTNAKKVYNLYGPTEDTTYSTYSCMVGRLNTAPTIGLPLAHSYARVLDTNLMPVPIGVVGELHLGGFGVSSGYLNKEELTKEKFTKDKNGSLLYATGDLVKLRWDGQLIYIGRKDHQVKIRGFRIELGEIERVLSQLEEVSDLVVVVKTVKNIEAIVVYLTSAADQPMVNSKLINAVSDFAKQTLPHYMVPKHIVPMDVIPLTSNGKYDRETLKKLSL